jgi:hypothetical protein
MLQMTPMSKQGDGPFGQQDEMQQLEGHEGGDNFYNVDLILLNEQEVPNLNAAEFNQRANELL